VQVAQAEYKAANYRYGAGQGNNGGPQTNTAGGARWCRYQQVVPQATAQAESHFYNHRSSTGVRAAAAAVQRNQVRKAQAAHGGKDGTAAQNTAATANRGGGGGGTGNDSTIASSGGSGVVVIRQAANAKSRPH
jgi:hypothetical protein